MTEVPAALINGCRVEGQRNIISKQKHKSGRLAKSSAFLCCEKSVMPYLCGRHFSIKEENVLYRGAKYLRNVHRKLQRRIV